jgi:sulfur-oxidizing protein SoxY
MKISTSRRRLLRFAGAAPLIWLASALKPVAAFAADWPKALFNAASPLDAIKQLQAQKAEAGTRILLDVPDIVDRNDSVAVRVFSNIPATEQITILVDMALRPVVAQFNLTGDALADVTTLVKLPGSSTIRAVVKAGGSTYVVTREVKLALESGCEGPLPPMPAEQKADKPAPRKGHKA